MKKILFSFLALSFLSSISLLSFAACPCQTTNKCSQKVECENVSPQCEQRNILNKCDKCLDLEDDEYFSYNQCFFDKQFKKLKRELCLTKHQECTLDSLYKTFKNDMECFQNKYKAEKNKLLEMINCNSDCQKEQIEVVKDLRKDIKNRCKQFKKDVKSVLCKNQYSDFRKVTRQEKKKMKKIVKYGAIYKLPCNNCCEK